MISSKIHNFCQPNVKLLFSDNLVERDFINKQVTKITCLEKFCKKAEYIKNLLDISNDTQVEISCLETDIGEICIVAYVNNCVLTHKAVLQWKNFRCVSEI